MHEKSIMPFIGLFIKID